MNAKSSPIDHTHISYSIRVQSLMAIEESEDHNTKKDPSNLGKETNTVFKVQRETVDHVDEKEIE